MRGLVTSGSMLNGDVLFQPGIGFADGTAVDVRTGSPLKAGAAARRDYEAMTELLRLAAEYTDGLPVRRGANRSLDEGAQVPDRDTAPLDMPDQ